MTEFRTIAFSGGKFLLAGILVSVCLMTSCRQATQIPSSQVSELTKTWAKCDDSIVDITYFEKEFKNLKDEIERAEKHYPESGIEPNRNAPSMGKGLAMATKNELARLPDEILRWLDDEVKAEKLSFAFGSEEGKERSLYRWRQDPITKELKSKIFLLDKRDMVHYSAKHEVGHMVDRGYRNPSSEQKLRNLQKLSLGDDFREIFYKQKLQGDREKLRSYAISSPSEYFAEVFGAWYCSEQMHLFIKTSLPTTYSFMEKVLPDPRFEVREGEYKGYENLEISPHWAESSWGQAELMREFRNNLQKLGHDTGSQPDPGTCEALENRQVDETKNKCNHKAGFFPRVVFDRDGSSSMGLVDIIMNDANEKIQIRGPWKCVCEGSDYVPGQKTGPTF